MAVGAPEARVRDRADTREREGREGHLTGPSDERHQRQRDERGAHREREPVEVRRRQEHADDRHHDEQHDMPRIVSRTVETRSVRRTVLRRGELQVRLRQQQQDDEEHDGRDRELARSPSVR